MRKICRVGRRLVFTNCLKHTDLAKHVVKLFQTDLPGVWNPLVACAHAHATSNPKSQPPTIKSPPRQLSVSSDTVYLIASLWRKVSTVRTVSDSARRSAGRRAALCLPIRAVAGSVGSLNDSRPRLRTHQTPQHPCHLHPVAPIVTPPGWLSHHRRRSSPRARAAV